MKTEYAKGFTDGGTASWQGFGEALEAGAVPFLPFGAQEQHGPHLPLQTDSIMATALAERVAALHRGILLPTLAYGETSNNAGFSGTLSLSAATVTAIATELGTALAAQGARGFVIVNGDFGNQAPLAAAARRLTTEVGLRTMVMNYPGMEQLAASIVTTEPAAPGFYHADEFETSIVLAVRPETVDLARAVASYPEFPSTYPAVFTPLHEISPSGVFGDPRSSTAETGEALLAGLVEHASALVAAFLATLR